MQVITNERLSPSRHAVSQQLGAETLCDIINDDSMDRAQDMVTALVDARQGSTAIGSSQGVVRTRKSAWEEAGTTSAMGRSSNECQR